MTLQMKKKLFIVIIILLVLFALSILIMSLMSARNTKDENAESECEELYSLCKSNLADYYEYYSNFSNMILNNQDKNISIDYENVKNFGYDPEIIFSIFEDISYQETGTIEYSRKEFSLDGLYYLEVSILYTNELKNNDYEHIMGDFYGNCFWERRNAI